MFIAPLSQTENAARLKKSSLHAFPLMSLHSRSAARIILSATPPASRKMRMAKHHPDGVARYQQFFIGGYDIAGQSRSVSRERAFRAGQRQVPLSIQPEACPFKAAADLLTNCRRVLANPAGEN